MPSTSFSPPSIPPPLTALSISRAADIDFEGGGRLICELTDCDPDKVAVGMKLEMTFRKMFSSRGIHNYFWKAKPASD